MPEKNNKFTQDYIGLEIGKTYKTEDILKRFAEHKQRLDQDYNFDIDTIEPLKPIYLEVKK